MTTHCCPRCGFPLEIVRAREVPDSPITPEVVVRCNTCGETAYGFSEVLALNNLDE